MLSNGVIKTKKSENLVGDIMNDPEELERMVSENDDSISVVINKNFMDNCQKPIVILAEKNKYMLNKKLIRETRKIIEEGNDNEPGIAEVYEEIEYSNDEFYQYVEEQVKSMRMDEYEIDEIMEILEEECPRIKFTKLVKRKITI